MKRPDKIIKWFHIEKEPDDIFVDHKGKQLYRYVIRVPWWIGRAYERGNLLHAKLEIRSKTPCINDQIKETNEAEADRYFKENWSKIVTKIRKANNGFILCASGGKGKGWFKSMADYEAYHKELRALNLRYGLIKPTIQECDEVSHA